MTNSVSPLGGAGRPKVALIAGPTASGKSDLAVRLALRLADRGRRAVVVNADSAQVYRDLALLSARPDAAAMRGIEHRLFGAWDGASACSAADWAARARAQVTALHDEGALPILVGGTGLYLRTLLFGIAPVPEIDPAIRQEVRALATVTAHAALRREDPAAAARLAPTDSSRIARALEVVRSTGRPLAAWQQRREGGIAADIALHPAVLLPPRDGLYARCEARFRAMLAAGAIAEVARLLARGLDPALPVMHAIGVPEIATHLRGEIDLAMLAELGARATRRYAKRQYTWFRHQPPADWPRVAQQDYDIDDIFVSLLRL
ncbi:MAG: tRNA (adenosine(37)-N6)-dimethylallyltransferase MiaA [Sphingomonadales bacterium]|nr:tRNA (adenosine(37)-N6)-dimethylallyltransferase MiaA [Sphingomonadales bacterium]